MNVNKININQSEPTYDIAHDSYDITYEDSNVGEKLTELENELYGFKVVVPFSINQGSGTIGIDNILKDVELKKGERIKIILDDENAVINRLYIIDSSYMEVLSVYNPEVGKEYEVVINRDTTSIGLYEESSYIQGTGNITVTLKYRYEYAISNSVNFLSETINSIEPVINNITTINSKNFRLFNKYFNTTFLEVGDSIDLNNSNDGFNQFSSEIIKVYKDDLISFDIWRGESDVNKAVVISEDSVVLQVFNLEKSQPALLNIQYDGYLLVCGYHIRDWNITGFRTTAYNFNINSLLKESTYIGKRIDFNNYPLIPTIINNNNHWNSVNKNYMCYLIPVDNAYIRFTTKSLVISYAFLTDNSHISVESPHYANGFTEIKDLGANDVHELVAPIDAKYLYLEAVYNGKYRLTGNTCEILNTSLLKEKVVEDLLSEIIKPFSCKIFRRVGCIGDSYTQGYIQLDGESAVGSNPEYSWPHYMETITHNKWTNFGLSGSTSKDWVNGKGRLAEVQAKGNKCQAYVIGLMLNDKNLTPQVPVGVYDDIFTQTDTYYSCYYRLIQAVIAVNTDAKIFCFTCPNFDINDAYNVAVRNIVTYCKSQNQNVFLLDLCNYNTKAYYKNEIMVADALNYHYSAIGYEFMAECLSRIMSDVINHEVGSFQNVFKIPFDE